MSRARVSGMDDRDALTERIIGCAISLHRSIGPGLAEKLYQRGLAIEFEASALRFVEKPLFNVHHRGQILGEFFPDFIVEDQVIVEIKSASAFDRVFEAQILTYLRVTKLRRGLLLNFGRPLMRDGIHRFVQD
jgi:GxxExxY protein